MTNTDEIRARLAACPSFAHRYTEHPTYTGSGCAHCGINRWAHHYHADVQALLDRIEALEAGLREVRDHLYTPQDYARVREAARALLDPAKGQV